MFLHPSSQQSQRYFSSTLETIMILCLHTLLQYSSGGPRISQWWGAKSPGAAPTYDFATLSQKLLEIERIWTRGCVQHLTMKIRHGIHMGHFNPQTPLKERITPGPGAYCERVHFCTVSCNSVRKTK